MGNIIRTQNKANKTMRKFNLLKKYFYECFSLFDMIHFNSQVSQNEYHKFISPQNECVIPISHRGIKDCRKNKSFDKKVLRFAFIGNETIYKGLPMLLNVLRSLDSNKQKWQLDVYGGHVGKENDIPVEYRGRYNNEMLDTIYNSMDLLIVPSVWKETFSLVTLEALSYGVPVLVSDNVGAKILVNEYDSRFVYHGKEELKKIICLILSHKEILVEYNKKIVEKQWHYSMRSHTKEIIELVYKLK